MSAGIPPEVWGEYRRLQAVRDAGMLSPADHAEFLRLSNHIEEYQADRVAALADLAARRGQSLAELADTLDLRPPADR
jgi:hypothetical protein